MARNRLKRQLRAIARDIPVGPGWDIVIVARAPAKDRDFAELRDTFRGLVARAGLDAPAAVDRDGER